MFSLNIFHAGGANVIMPQFDPQKALELIEFEKDYNRLLLLSHVGTGR
jgi:hypothetical protein